MKTEKCKCDNCEIIFTRTKTYKKTIKTYCSRKCSDESFVGVERKNPRNRIDECVRAINARKKARESV